MDLIWKPLGRDPTDQDMIPLIGVGPHALE